MTPEHPEPTILLHWAADGTFTHGASSDVLIICIDERTPADRVYINHGQADYRWMTAVVGGADPRVAAGQEAVQ